MYNKVNSKETEKKENNITRPIFSLSFMIMLVLLSIAYAYLAVSIDKKVNGPKGVSPGNEDEPSNVVSNSNIIPNSNSNYEPDDNPESNEKSNSNSNPTSKSNSNPTSKSNSNSNCVGSKCNSNPTSTVIIDKPNWQIIFENVEIKDGSVKAISEPTIDSAKTTVSYEVALSEPGEYYSFNVDIVNKGTMDAKIYDIIEKALTERQKRYLDYTIKYKNGNTIKIGDTLLAKERKTVTVWLKFKDDLSKEDLPDKDEVLKLTYQIVYVEK